ncbi:MAG: tRNA (adenosine(37)-N6)-dimethylallyltransferase MiaA [Blastocatellia bacterium]
MALEGPSVQDSPECEGLSRVLLSCFLVKPPPLSYYRAMSSENRSEQVSICISNIRDDPKAVAKYAYFVVIIQIMNPRVKVGSGPIPFDAKPIIAIAGPTASGKSALAVRVALAVGGEVVNFDSVQIYKGIQVATAKPSEEEKCGVPHHLIDYVDPNTDYSAADWVADARRVIVEIETRGRVPVLVGGTGFYLRSLRQPLFESPKTDPALRKRLKEIGRSQGAEYLYRILEKLDPEAAKRFEKRDVPRIIRAIEVIFATGRRFSQLILQRPAAPDFVRRIRLFVLEPPREDLYRIINQRTEQHFAAGLVDEVKELIGKGVNQAGSALGAHGYRRVCEYLRGERDLEATIEKTKQDVRNYAKRQFTWFRKENDAIRLGGFGTDERIFEKLIAEMSCSVYQNNARIMHLPR